MNSNNHKSSSIELNGLYRAFIEALFKALELQDPYTAKHQQHVANLSVRIAQKLNWPNSRIEGLFLAALIHDLGKIAISQDVLTKTTPLSEEDVASIRTHPSSAYQILKEISFPWPIAKIVEQHHERLDGSGYPKRLLKNEILDEAKIIAVADTLEAMALTRPYRVGLGMNAALAEIHAEAGLKLDQEYVEIASELTREYGEAVFY